MTAECVQCHTPIVDYSSVTEIDGAIYCCANCAAARRGRSELPDLPLCAHCGSAIVGPETLIERHGERFCCYNCASAQGVAV